MSGTGSGEPCTAFTGGRIRDGFRLRQPLKQICAAVPGGLQRCLISWRNRGGYLKYFIIMLIIWRLRSIGTRLRDNGGTIFFVGSGYDKVM